MRFHLFEFEDLRWFPQVVREGMMDFLRHMITWLNFYGPVTPLIRDTMEHSNDDVLLELCAGGGGGVLKLRENLNALGSHPKIFLSDLFPNHPIYEQLKNITHGEIDFVPESINALDVPSRWRSMRIIFSAFHHFKPLQAQDILEDAWNKKVAIGIFDAGTKSIFTIIGIIVLQPIVFFLTTPFFKPFRWSRLIFTYVIPLIPLCTMWDGCVSVLRFYTLRQLISFTAQLNSKDYIWKVGQLKNSIGVKVNYVVGYPLQKNIS